MNIDLTQIIIAALPVAAAIFTGGAVAVKSGLTATIHAGMKAAKRKITDAIAAPIQARQAAAADKAAASLAVSQRIQELADEKAATMSRIADLEKLVAEIQKMPTPTVPTVTTRVSTKPPTETTPPV